MSAWSLLSEAVRLAQADDRLWSRTKQVCGSLELPCYLYPTGMARQAVGAVGLERRCTLSLLFHQKPYTCYHLKLGSNPSAVVRLQTW